jgi:hypothetical protein
MYAVYQLLSEAVLAKILLSLTIVDHWIMFDLVEPRAGRVLFALSAFYKLAHALRVMPDVARRPPFLRLLDKSEHAVGCVDRVNKVPGRVEKIDAARGPECRSQRD